MSLPLIPASSMAAQVASRPRSWRPLSRNFPKRVMPTPIMTTSLMLSSLPLFYRPEFVAHDFIATGVFAQLFDDQLHIHAGLQSGAGHIRPGYLRPYPGPSDQDVALDGGGRETRQGRVTGAVSIQLAIP